MNINLSPKPKLGLIAGPTASGKSALALRVAAAVGGTVVNADSAQVYRDLRILSARPSEAEERAVPHRLFGHVDGAEACSAARWAADARSAIGDAHAERRIPILVGGTGLYIRTLLDGIAPIPPIDPEVRAAVRALPVERARQALEREDPAAASRLGPADTARITRALEVVRSTGRPIGEWQARRTGGITGEVELVPLLLLPSRDWLYERCDRRFEAMLERGAAAEVAALLARGLDPDLPVMRAIGVREIAAMLSGETDRDATAATASQATRRYAKRQYTWFARQTPSAWTRCIESEYDQNAAQMITKLQ